MYVHEGRLKILERLFLLKMSDNVSCIFEDKYDEDESI
jgi:hypothetical protein